MTPPRLPVLLVSVSLTSEFTDKGSNRNRIRGNETLVCGKEMVEVFVLVEGTLPFFSV